jgi:hypothetical protein
MLIDLELEKGSWEAVRAHTGAATVSGSAAPFGWDALVTLAAVVILIGAGRYPSVHAILEIFWGHGAY